MDAKGSEVSGPPRVRLKELKVSGFRSLKEIREWCPGDLNILIGPNASGKSNVLYALEMLAASADRRLQKSVQLSGGMESLRWDCSAESVRLEVVTTLPGLEEGWYYDLPLLPVGQSSLFRFGAERLLGGQPGQRTLVFERRHDGTVSLARDSSVEVIATNQYDAGESVLSQMTGPFQKNRAVAQFQQELAKWSVHLTLDTSRRSELRRDPVSRYDPGPSIDADNLINVLHTLYSRDRHFEQAMDEALRAALGEDYGKLQIHPAADQRIQLAIRWKSLSKDRPSSDMADGVLRFIYLITILANPDIPGLVAIDEPETGLHPSMLPIVAEYAAEAATRAQVIFTTHSPEFLDAFRGITPTVTVVTSKEGQTVLSKLEDEELRRWLQDFSLGELHRSRAAEAIR